jgi:hypothetical protein
MIRTLDNLVPAILQNPRQRVPDDRRSKMPDVHLFGDVGGGVVDYHAPPMVSWDQGRQNSGVEGVGETGFEVVCGKVDVDEARAGGDEFAD